MPLVISRKKVEKMKARYWQRNSIRKFSKVKGYMVVDWKDSQSVQHNVKIINSERYLGMKFQEHTREDPNLKERDGKRIKKERTWRERRKEKTDFIHHSPPHQKRNLNDVECLKNRIGCKRMLGAKNSKEIISNQEFYSHLNC